MSPRCWYGRTTLAAAAVVVGLTGCSAQTVDPGSAAPSSAPSVSVSPTAPALVISDAAATGLCDMFRPELSNFRVQGPSLGRLSYNLMVQDWAFRNGGINGQVLADKAVIDRVTTKSCADVRSEMLTSLDLPTLAAGLAF
ncbi:hypothetical protein [Nocardia camponoti]|uniref:Lipoprotein n=1 Tax=Nocardia camponoti TaxID=1616106 RepID=A0A917QNS5_9NOCA|nr:hypothetical protein [Nocardia camponoti]GGK61413.1 hypothetical protein GCM10011591_37170 [Nocardia camponoti]